MDTTNTDSTTIEGKPSNPELRLSVPPAPVPAPIPPRTLGRASASGGSFLSRGSFLSVDFRSELEEAGECALVPVGRGNVNVVSMSPPPAAPKPRVEDVMVPAAAEIFVNGEGYTLGNDGMFGPNRRPDTPFDGYAVFSHGVFKPLGGSPAAIDSRTLYRVIAATTGRGRGAQHGGLPLHRIKSVLQLLARGTSGHSEHLFVYDERRQGFVQSNRTRRFPAADTVERPGEFGEIVSHSRGSAADKLVWEGQQRRGVNRGGMVLRSYSAPLGRALTPPLAEVKIAQDVLTSSLGGGGGGRGRGRGGRRLFEEPRLRFEDHRPLRAQRALLDDDDDDDDDDDRQRSWLHLDEDFTTAQGTGGGRRPGDGTVSPFPPRGSSSRFKEGQPNYRSPPLFSSTAAGVVLATTIPKKTPGEEAGGVDTFSPAAAPLHAPDPPQFALTITVRSSSYSPSHPRTSRVDVPSSDFTDEDFFTLLRREHNRLCGPWRAALSLKGVRCIKLAQNHRKCNSNYPRRRRPPPPPPPPPSLPAGSISGNSTSTSTSRSSFFLFFSQRSLLKHFHRPASAGGGMRWVAAACDGEVALDLSHGWLPSRILVAGAAPLLVSAAATVAWCLVGPGGERALSTAFLFGWLVLAVGGGCVAVVAVLSVVM